MSGTAENQANVNISYKKFYAIRKLINQKFGEKFYYDMQMDYVSRALKFGDTQPAVVVNTNPLLIAAYSDEMDAVVMLQFPRELADQYALAIGTRLTTSTVYFYDPGRYGSDFVHGERSSKQYRDFMPIVQLFLGKKDEYINSKVNLFNAAVWDRLNMLANKYLEDHPNTARHGFYYFKKN